MSITYDSFIAQPPLGRRRRRSTAAISMTAVSALLLSACGGGAGGEAGDQVEGGGTLTTYTCEPQNLQPGNNTENCGSRVLDQLFTGLTDIDHDSGEAEPALAESWETEDNITWTFHLEEDYTFHNGDPVTAQTFVDTWNWVVHPDHVQAGATFHDKFAGYEEVADGEAEQMEGIRAVDDYTLEIELTEPFGQLPVMLTYTSFLPMPDEAFEDMDAFQDAPIGNGRYEMDGEWVRNQEVAMDRYDDWPGDEPGEPERIEWQIYSDIESAYMDVQAGELDVLGEVPPSRIPQIEEDFGQNYEQYQTSRLVYIGMPMYQEAFADADLRRALSLAMDREEINDQIFDGAMTPAYSILPPTLPMAREDVCDYCDYDPEAAAELYEEADGPSELTLYTDTGTGHEEYIEAIGNQWTANLPVEDISYQSMEFAQYLDMLEEDDATGPFRLGWLLAYPSPQYALEPLYSSEAPSNDAGYSSEEFDEAIEEANDADLEESDELYQAAEDILLEDLPVLPLFHQDYFVVHSDRVENVAMDQSTYIRVEDVVVTEN